ncbi:hypothetical protein M8J75_001643 [Diaphorina citri]|nr:hypothetical protein M8J75_001643 [Diaphorina citri]
MSEAKEGDPGGGGGNPLPPNLNSTDGNAVVMETTEARASSGAQNLDGNTASSGQKHLVLYKPGMRCDLYKLIVQLKPNLDPTPHSTNGKRPYRYIRGLLLSKLIAEITNKSKEVVEIKRLNRSKFLISCTTSKCANLLVENEKMKEKFIAYVPMNYVSRAAIVKDVDLEITDDEIMQNIDCGDFKITQMQRLNRKTFVDGKATYVPSTTIKLLFEGQDMPSFVYLWYTKLNCEPYIQNPIQCFSCFQFGHITKSCRNKKLCRKCFQEDLHDHACDFAEIKCLNCSGMHNANSKSCPEYERQRSIKVLMSTRSLCFPEANALVPRPRDTFAIRTSNRFDVLTEENSDEVRSNNRNNYNTQYPPLPSNVPTNHRNITRYVPPAISDIRRPKRKSDKEMDNRESNQNKKNRQHLEEMTRMTKPESYYTGNQISQLMYKGLEENKQHKANHEHQQWMKLTHPTIAFSGIPNSSEFEDLNMEQNFSLEHSERNENTYNSNYHGSSYPGSPDFS